MYRSLFRPLLFRLDPETAHGLTLQLIRLAGRIAPVRVLLQAAFASPEKPVEVLGLRFPNPVGLAAGYDKDGVAVRGLAALGFGHIEVGTITVRAQPGNPRPRLFRLAADEALINRMGFPGRGADFAVQMLAHRRPPGLILGVNLGKNKDTPLEQAAADYRELLQRFWPLADYLAINISSPNTVGLRRLQGRDMLTGLLGALGRERGHLASLHGNRPILVKLAPDLSDGELEDALEVILDTGMDGIIATNTTLARPGLVSPHQVEAGGLSGAPLAGRSEQVLAWLVRAVGGRLPVVSVGGIRTPKDVQRRLDMGAALVQVYTGLVYGGPGLIREIIRAV